MTSMQHHSRIRARFWAAAAFALLAGTIALADAASAQPINGRARWCMTFEFGGTYDCAYHSLEQCMASAAGVTNQCSLNPWYAGPREPRPRQRDQRR